MRFFAYFLAVLVLFALSDSSVAQDGRLPPTPNSAD
jgi:hypothetical protein